MGFIEQLQMEGIFSLIQVVSIYWFWQRDNMGVHYRTEKHKGIPVFEVDGRISGEDAIRISRKLEDFVREPFREIDFVDSNWLGVFAHCLHIYRERRKRIYFVVKSEFVRNVLKSSNIDKLATIVSSFEAI